MILRMLTDIEIELLIHNPWRDARDLVLAVEEKIHKINNPAAYTQTDRYKVAVTDAQRATPVDLSSRPLIAEVVSK